MAAGVEQGQTGVLSAGRMAYSHQGEAGTVAREALVGDEGLGDALGTQLDGRLAKGEGVGLGEEVAHELIVV